MKQLLGQIILLFVPIALSAQWLTSPSGDAYNNNSSGKVGIGTSTPAARLHVADGGFRHGGTGEINIDAIGVIGGRFKIMDNGFVGIGNNNPVGTLTVGSIVYANPSAAGITLGRDQNSIEFVHSAFGQGYGARMYGSDEGNGLTSFHLAVKGNSSSWTDAMYVRAGDNGAGGGKLGYVGIGTNNPQARLHIHESENLGNSINNNKLIASTSGNSPNHFASNLWLLRDDSNGGGQWWNARLHDGISIDYTFVNPGQDTKTWWERDPNDNIQSWGNANQTYMTLKQGLVGIGTATPDKLLTVKGTIHTNEVLVDMNVSGPDYVFEKDYDLLSLSELERYIKQNKHLPEVPSAKEMEQEGLNLKEMNLLLLKKIEELSLHMIDLKNQNERQQAEIENLKSRIK